MTIMGGEQAESCLLPLLLLMVTWGQLPGSHLSFADAGNCLFIAVG